MLQEIFQNITNLFQQSLHIYMSNTLFQDEPSSILSGSNLKPLQNIKNIQQSLLGLKNKLSQMHKQQSQNGQKVQKLIEQGIPLLRHKLSQSQSFQQFQAKKTFYKSGPLLNQLREKNREKRLINRKQIQRNRESASLNRINQYTSLKQQSKKNDFIIKKRKDQQLQQNIRKRERVRGSIQNSREKVNQFHLHKKLDIKKQKEQEKLKMQRKVLKMAKEMHILSQFHEQTSQTVKSGGQTLIKIKAALRRLEKMKEPDFLKIWEHLEGKESENNDQHQTLQRILQHIIQQAPGQV